MNHKLKPTVHYIPAACLAVASPMIGELLSSSTPPLQFFVWWVFLLFVLLYGSCCVLIRELTIRWSSGWTGLLVLGTAFGILDEGILTRAFFDPAWPSLGPLAGHGRWFGINVIWTIDALLYHSIVSMVIPIALIHLLFPVSARTPWLRRWHLWTIAVPLSLTLILFLKAGNKYALNPLYLSACVVAIGFLFLLARFAGVVPARNYPPRHRDSLRFFLLGFSGLSAIFIQMYVLPPLLKLPALTLATLVAIIVFGNRLVRNWSGNGECWTPLQQFSLIAGVLTCMALMCAFQEINPQRVPRPVGTSLVAIGCITFLVVARSRVRRLGDSIPVPQTATLAMAASAGAEEVFAASAAPQVRTETEQAAAANDIPLLLRAVEVGIASTLLILTAPVMLVLAILIRRDTPGPALFFQSRLGRNCVPFSFVKFRTLFVDSRQRFPELYAYKYTGRELEALKFKIVRDPRVTPQGEWMRRSTLDELPNFWNVLTGDMALVGPRPEIPEMLPYYTGHMRRKFAVRPGITGLAQISGRGRLGFYETVKLDLEYVKTRSFALDARILALTAYKIITRDGAF